MDEERWLKLAVQTIGVGPVERMVKRPTAQQDPIVTGLIAHPGPEAQLDA